MDCKVNFLTIITDQQRFDLLSCLGNGNIKTPNLDQLASSGTLFKQAICTYPLCGPSRASLLTGQYAHGHNFRKNAELYEEGMSEEVDTVDEMLSREGYNTFYIGKWHTGKANTQCYNDGIEYYLDQYKKFIDKKYGSSMKRSSKIDRYTKLEYEPILLDEMMQKAANDGFHMPHHNEAGIMDIDPEDSLTAWTVKKAIRFLSSKPEEPFALTCSILHPHAPLIISSDKFHKLSKYDILLPDNMSDNIDYKKPSPIPDVLDLSENGLRMYMAIYYSLIEEIDEWVGKLLAALTDTGLEENTMIIFTSDHGDLMGSHSTLSKMEMFEESIRVPLIISFPGKINENIISEYLATGADIMPTVLDFAGIPLPDNIHGESLKPILTAKSNLNREYAYCELNEQKVVRSAGWKLVLNPKLDSNINHKYLLFNLKVDPLEKNNLLSSENLNNKIIVMAEKLKKEMINLMRKIYVPEKDIVKYQNIAFTQNCQ